MFNARVTGLDKVVRNLNREIGGIKGRTKGGLREAGNHILNVAHPTVPHSGSGQIVGGRKRSGGGTLRRSRFVRTMDTNRGPAALVGYSAPYAVYVHEIRVKHPVRNWTTPGTGHKFLENAAKHESREVVAIVRRRARVRP